MSKNYRKYIIGTLVVLTMAVASSALAAPAETAPVTGIQPPVTSCPAETASLPRIPATKEKFGTIKQDSLSELPLNERLRCDPTVKTMWKMMLNLADVLVALFFLAVAFATILHINYDTYGVKKALPPLLIGIVLAHFSLPIVYSIVDFAQIMSAGFYNSASSELGAPGLAKNISAAIFSGGLTKTGAAVTTVGFYTFLTMFTFLGIASGGTLIPVLFIAAIIIGLIAMAIPSILILVLSFLLYARFYIILFLTIVAPLAWLTQAWGPVQGFFKKWWSQFTMWVFMAPVVVFFLWIAVAFSQASMDSGSANFGTYVITLVMFYLAITTPFKMGGQIMSSWGGLGKKAAAIGYKGANAAGGAGLDRAGTWKMPGGKRLADFGVKSGAAWKQGLKTRFERASKQNRETMAASVAFGNFSPVLPGRNFLQRAGERWVGPSILDDSRVRGTSRKDVMDRWVTGRTAGERETAISSDHDMSADQALMLILEMARNGEHVEQAMVNYQTRFRNNPRDNERYVEQLNDVLRTSKPHQMVMPTNITPEVVNAIADPTEQARRQGLQDQFRMNQERSVDMWFSRENLERSARDFTQVQRYTDPGALTAVTNRLVAAEMQLTTTGTDWHDTANNVTYHHSDLQNIRDEIGRIGQNGNNSFATYINVGDYNGNDLSAGGMGMILRRLAQNPAMHTNLENRGAPVAVTNVSGQFS